MTSGNCEWCTEDMVESQEYSHCTNEDRCHCDQAGCSAHGFTWTARGTACYSCIEALSENHGATIIQASPACHDFEQRGGQNNTEAYQAFDCGCFDAWHEGLMPLVFERCGECNDPAEVDTWVETRARPYLIGFSAPVQECALPSASEYDP